MVFSFCEAAPLAAFTPGRSRNRILDAAKEFLGAERRHHRATYATRRPIRRRALDVDVTIDETVAEARRAVRGGIVGSAERRRRSGRSAAALGSPRPTLDEEDRCG
jgi:hypothetical protein